MKKKKDFDGQNRTLVKLSVKYILNFSQTKYYVAC
jgi:hypothetical protein